MDNERHIEAAADRIVQWAASHPLSGSETEARYAHLLKGLEPMADRDRARLGLFHLGSLVVQYWREKVQDFSASLGTGGLTPALGLRGAAPAPSPVAPERTLKAEGSSGTACVKLTASADPSTVDLVLWLEPKIPGGDQPFTVTVLDSAQAQLGAPVSCAARNLVRFDGIPPAAEYTLIFATTAERWEIRWGFAPAEASSRESTDQ